MSSKTLAASRKFGAAEHNGNGYRYHKMVTTMTEYEKYRLLVAQVKGNKK